LREFSVSASGEIHNKRLGFASVENLKLPPESRRPWLVLGNRSAVPDCPDCPDSPLPTPEHGISEKDIIEQEIFELVSPDHSFLSGPRSRIHDFGTLFRVGADFLRAFGILHFVGPCVTIFGSARSKPGTTYYELARKMGEACAKLGFTVMTGGGAGIMEAGNRGAFEAGGRSIGVNIELPFEQHLNPYVQKSFTMRYFFTRKTVLIKYSYTFIVLPGGAGTLDEMFETRTLIQTGKLRNFPIILMDADSHWGDGKHENIPVCLAGMECARLSQFPSIGFRVAS